jgi:hypothetical protein
MLKPESVIVKTTRPAKPDIDLREAYILAMYLLWASRPSKQSSEPDGSYFIGEITQPRLQDQRLNRETSYSVCMGIRD